MNRTGLDGARPIVAKGAKLGLKPPTGAVLDAGGHLIALQRQGGASNMRPQIAIR